MGFSPITPPAAIRPSSLRPSHGNTLNHSNWLKTDTDCKARRLAEKDWQVLLQTFARICWSVSLWLHKAVLPSSSLGISLRSGTSSQGVENRHQASMAWHAATKCRTRDQATRTAVKHWRREERSALGISGRQSGGGTTSGRRQAQLIAVEAIKTNQMRQGCCRLVADVGLNQTWRLMTHGRCTTSNLPIGV